MAVRVPSAFALGESYLRVDFPRLRSRKGILSVSYTHLTLPTNREV